MDTVWAVVVARVGTGAKSRLAGVLSVSQRRELALAMLADVLDVCARAGLVGTLAVVDTPVARAIAEQSGATVVADPATGDMNAAVAAGLEVACQKGATTAVVLPGDVPLIVLDDFDALLAAAASAPRAVVVGVSHDGQGTNALLLRPADVIAPRFGPPSLQQHVQAGLAAGALTLVRPDLGLALDVDTPEDLATLRAASQIGHHTAAVLGGLQLAHI